MKIRDFMGAVFFTAFFVVWAGIAQETATPGGEETTTVGSLTHDTWYWR